MKLHVRVVARSVMSVAAVTALAACGGTSSSTPAATPTATAAAAEVTVTATEFKFDPDAFDMESGKATTIELVNGGTIEHDFTIDELAIMIHAGVGETASDTVGPLEPGTYEYYCSIPGHREAGMVGELTVP